MKRINMNEFAKRVAEIEGKKKSQDIAQIKETLRIALGVLANNYLPSEVMELLERYK